MRKLSLIIAFILLLSFVFGSLSGCSKDTKYIDGNKWLVMQEKCFDDLSAYTTGMDEVYSLYFSGGISAMDFENELRVLRKEYDILCAFYNDMKQKNPVVENGHSYLSKYGSDCMQRAYEILGEMFDATHNADGTLKSPNELSYNYLAFRQNFMDQLSGYVTALAAYHTILEEQQKASAASGH